MCFMKKCHLYLYVLFMKENWAVVDFIQMLTLDRALDILKTKKNMSRNWAAMDFPMFTIQSWRCPAFFFP